MQPQFPREQIHWQRYIEQLLLQHDVDVKRLWRRVTGMQSQYGETSIGGNGTGGTIPVIFPPPSVPGTPPGPGDGEPGGGLPDDPDYPPGVGGGGGIGGGGGGGGPDGPDWPHPAGESGSDVAPSGIGYSGANSGSDGTSGATSGSAPDGSGASGGQSGQSGISGSGGEFSGGASGGQSGFTSGSQSDGTSGGLSDGTSGATSGSAATTVSCGVHEVPKTLTANMTYGSGCAVGSNPATITLNWVSGSTWSGSGGAWTVGFSCGTTTVGMSIECVAASESRSASNITPTSWSPFDATHNFTGLATTMDPECCSSAKNDFVTINITE